MTLCCSNKDNVRPPGNTRVLLLQMTTSENHDLLMPQNEQGDRGKLPGQRLDPLLSLGLPFERRGTSRVLSAKFKVFRRSNRPPRAVSWSFRTLIFPNPKIKQNSRCCGGRSRRRVGAAPTDGRIPTGEFCVGLG